MGPFVMVTMPKASLDALELDEDLLLGIDGFLALEFADRHDAAVRFFGVNLLCAFSDKGSFWSLTPSVSTASFAGAGP